MTRLLIHNIIRWSQYMTEPVHHYIPTGLVTQFKGPGQPACMTTLVLEKAHQAVGLGRPLSRSGSSTRVISQHSYFSAVFYSRIRKVLQHKCPGLRS